MLARNKMYNYMAVEIINELDLSHLNRAAGAIDEAAANIRSAASSAIALCLYDFATGNEDIQKNIDEILTNAKAKYHKLMP